MKNPYRVVCLGNVLVDVLVKPVDVLPPKGGLLPVDQVEVALGGCASNTALALSRLGVKTSLWGKVGRDHFSDFALKQLKQGGVETSGMRIDPKVSTSATLVLVDSKARRSFLHSVAANDHIHLSDLKLSHLRAFKHLHIGGYFLFPKLDGLSMAGILKTAQGMGLTTSLDTAWDLKGRWMKALKPCLPYLDYFMPSEREVKKLLPSLHFGKPRNRELGKSFSRLNSDNEKWLGHIQTRKAALAFLKLGARCVIIKRGEKGSYLLHQNGREFHVPAFKAKTVDTTGAGDCFCAGFIKGLSLRWSYWDCLRLGNAAGACAVGALGATAGIRSFSQVRRLLQK